MSRRPIVVHVATANRRSCRDGQSSFMSRRPIVIQVATANRRSCRSRTALAGCGRIRGVRIGPNVSSKRGSIRSDKGATPLVCDRRATKLSAEQAGTKLRREKHRWTATRHRHVSAFGKRIARNRTPNTNGVVRFGSSKTNAVVREPAPRWDLVRQRWDLVRQLMGCGLARRGRRHFGRMKWHVYPFG